MEKIKSHKNLGRLFLIIGILKSNHFNKNKSISAHELLNKVNQKLEIQDFNSISERTLKRDINSLKSAPFNLNINSNKNGYSVELDSETDFSSPVYFFEPYYLLHNVYFLTGLEEILFPEKMPKAGTQWVYELIKIIKTRGKVSLCYKKHGEEIEIRTVFPIVLKQFNGIWYLIAKDKDTLRTFGLDRVLDLKKESGKLKISEFSGLQKSIQSKFEHSFGIYSDEKYPIENVMLKFDEIDSAYILANPLHHSQKFNAEDNTFSLRLRITEDFKMALMSRIWSLEILKPISLRKEIRNYIKQALDRNS